MFGSRYLGWKGIPSVMRIAGFVVICSSFMLGILSAWLPCVCHWPGLAQLAFDKCPPPGEVSGGGHWSVDGNFTLFPLQGTWSSAAILLFKHLCRFKEFVGIVDEYVDGVLYLFLCDTSTKEDIYFHSVLRDMGYADICGENIPSQVRREAERKGKGRIPIWVPVRGRFLPWSKWFCKEQDWYSLLSCNFSFCDCIPECLTLWGELAFWLRWNLMVPQRCSV